MVQLAVIGSCCSGGKGVRGGREREKTEWREGGSGDQQGGKW
jgi:hypothetical protein